MNKLNYKTVVLTEIPNDKVSIKDVGVDKFYGVQYKEHKYFILCRKCENDLEAEYVIQQANCISIATELRKDASLKTLISNAISLWHCGVYEFNNAKDLYKWLSED